MKPEDTKTNTLTKKKKIKKSQKVQNTKTTQEEQKKIKKDQQWLLDLVCDWTETIP